MKDTSYRRAIQLLEAGIGDELVALEPDKGNCFGFNEVATWVWRRLAEPATFEQLRDGLLIEYEVGGEQCTVELKALLDELIARGLIAKAS
jgi:hypothetical protein